ncbi:MAG TPA: MarC family protein [Chloroflexota bacterium]|nr:MarC family protein [Chloroflexota bacterium]
MDGELGRAFVAFFAVVDPVGNVLVFYLLTAALRAADRLRVALVAIGAAGALLLLFSVAGSEVLAFLAISAASFRVAAGLLLLLPAYRLVSGGQPAEVTGPSAAAPVEMALVPLAMPLLAGPGALATATALTASLGLGRTLVALGAVLLLTFAMFAAADWLLRWLGRPLLRLLARLVGLLLFTIAVEFVLSGLRAYFGAS